MSDFSIYSNTLKGLSLIAGFLTVGSVTDKTIAITAVRRLLLTVVKTEGSFADSHD